MDFLLKIWKTNERDESKISVEQLSIALRTISARLAHAITNRDTRFFKLKRKETLFEILDKNNPTVSVRSEVSITPKTAFPSYLKPPIKYESK